MVIAEILVVSDPKYSFTIGSENYFSFTVAGTLGMIFLFMFFAIKLTDKIELSEEKLSLGKGKTTKVSKIRN